MWWTAASSCAHEFLLPSLSSTSLEAKCRLCVLSCVLSPVKSPYLFHGGLTCQQSWDYCRRDDKISTVMPNHLSLRAGSKAVIGCSFPALAFLHCLLETQLPASLPPSFPISKLVGLRIPLKRIFGWLKNAWRSLSSLTALMAVKRENHLIW